ncbi:hypothetical protein Taro_040682 [Colocasia esculenta]|uniref:Aminotransferase-like plant mobile domain-containing protein n=1 Tax=Colocasia esculenta TaxID=4460 RepID=A0A843WDU2_COLES|nr:hypothetical protein [Colocasia esculenta]
MPRGRGYLSRNDYTQRTRDKVVLLDDMMPSLEEPRVTSKNSSLLDSGNNNVAEVDSDNLLAKGGVDISRISRLKGAYHYSREEDYPAHLPTDPELFNFIQNFLPSHMTTGDPCLSAKRRYLESAILKSRDSLLGTCAFSYPSFPLRFAVQQRLPPIADLGPFSHDLNSYTRPRKISPAVWRLTNRHQTKPETDGLQLMPCDTRCISGGYDNRCLLNRIVDLTSPSWYGSWSVLSSRVFHFGATEWLMGVLHHYGEILKLSGIYEAVEAALYNYPCHTGLLQTLVERFNARWNTFGTAEGETSIDLWSFHWISGLPISGGFYEEVVLDDLHTYRSNGAGQYILPYSLRFLTKVWRHLALIGRKDDPDSPLLNLRGGTLAGYQIALTWPHIWQYYQGEMPLLEPIELLGRKTTDIHGWVRWEKHLTIAIGHAGPLEFLPRLENARTLHDVRNIMQRVDTPAQRIGGGRSNQGHSLPSRGGRVDKGKAVECPPLNDDEADEEDNALTLSDDQGSLPEGCPPIHREECGSTSQASAGILPENAYYEVPPNFEFSEIAAGNNNPRFTFAELGVSSGQYSSVPSEVYIPVPVEEPTVTAEAPLGERDFVQPPNSGMENRERNPSPGFVNSPALEIGVSSEHNITWPTEARPDSSSDDEDTGVWNYLVEVQTVVNSANPPPIEAVRRVLEKYTTRAFTMGVSRDRWMGFVKTIWDKVYSLHVDMTWAPYSQRLQVLESDICSLSSDIDESDSRVADVRKRRTTRELRMATRGENIAWLERELGKERSSQAQDARDETKDSEEEAVLIRDGDGSRRVRSVKIKEAERLKRKQPTCLCFSS